MTNNLSTNRPSLRWFVTAALAVGSCNVVDESQIRNTDLDFLNLCEADPELAVNNTSETRRLDFSLYSNERNTSASGCGLNGLDGPEGYFMFQSRPEQRWQVRATPTGDADVALFVDNQCDQGACVAARDRCGAGLAESFTFIAPESPTGGGETLYSLVVDTHDPYEGRIDVVLVSAACGDGKLDPGEGCDVGPENGPNDGCSITCQNEIDLSNSNPVGIEREPNDSVPSGNIVLVPSVDAFTTPITISGRVGGGCDDDVFQIVFTGGSSTGRTFEASLVATCDATPPAKLQILSALGGRKIDLVAEQLQEGQCPTLTQEIAVGRGYFVQVQAADDEVEQYDYSLQLRLLPAEAGEESETMDGETDGSDTDIDTDGETDADTDGGTGGESSGGAAASVDEYGRFSVTNTQDGA